MKPLLVFPCTALLFVACAKESSNPVIAPNQTLSTTIVFGQEKGTPQNQFIHFVPLPFQDTTNLQYLNLSELQNLCIQVTERGIPINPNTLDPSKIIFHVFTMHDREGFEGDVNFSFLGWAFEESESMTQTDFEAILPMAVNPAIVQHNGTVEFTGNEDDYFSIRYVSPFTGMTVLDTVIITKDI